MNITETKKGSITIMHVAGRLDATTATELNQHTTAIIEGGARLVVLDMSGLEYVSSAGLRVILSAAKHMQKAEGKLVLAAASPQGRQTLDMAGFSAIIPLYNSIEEACDELLPTPSSQSSMEHPLSFAEEIYLLALDDEQGFVKPMPTSALDYALAAALLMELALNDRIDTDPNALKVISTEPLGDPLLDDVLKQLQESAEPQPVAHWLKQIVVQAERIEELVLARLIAKGILKQQDRRILWVFAVRCYPLIDNREVKEVRTRLRELILSDEIPDARDIVLICLGNACQLLDDFFTAEELKQAEPRITALARLDLIGREMSKAISEIERAMDIAMSMRPMM